MHKKLAIVNFDKPLDVFCTYSSLYVHVCILHFPELGICDPQQPKRVSNVGTSNIYVDDLFDPPHLGLIITF